MQTEKHHRHVAGVRRRGAELAGELLNERDRRIAAEKKLSSKRFAWITPLGTLITSLTAIGALIFTSSTLRQTAAQNNIAEQGQITSRYAAAIDQLGSSSEDIRLGGIYSLRRIMHDSPADETTIVDVLSAFIRNHPPGSLNPTSHPKLPLAKPPTDVAAALTVLGDRNALKDLPTIVDLRGIDLADLDLSELNLKLQFADLTSANLEGTSFTIYTAPTKNLSVQSSADLSNADLEDANLAGANLTGATLRWADFTNANLTDAELSTADLTYANLGNADLASASLLYANLSFADASTASFVKAALENANLTMANFDSADLTGAYTDHSTFTNTNFAYTPMCHDTTPVRKLGYLCSDQQWELLYNSR